MQELNKREIQILEYLKKEKSACLSTIAKNLKIHLYQMNNLVKSLEEKGLIKVEIFGVKFKRISLKK